MLPKELWTVEQTAQFLGIKVKSLYQKVYRGQIPCVKLGAKFLRFDPEELEKWIEKSKRVAFAYEKGNLDNFC